MTAASKYQYRYGEDPTDGGEAAPRPHRAIRLMDEPEGEAPPAGKRRAPSVSKPVTEPAQRSAFKSAQKSAPLPPAARETEYLPFVQGVASDGDPFEEMPIGDDGDASAVSPTPSAAAHTAAYAVLSVRPEGEGACVTVILRTPTAEEGERPGRHSVRHSVRQTLHLLVEQYAELGVQVGEITRMQAFALREAGALCAAIRRGLSILSCGDQSARRLAYKLTVKGVDREVAEKAAAYLVDKGYIREENTARRRAEQSLRKLYGPRRIREDLRSLGFSPEAVEETMESLAAVDFCENCQKAMAKKYGEIPADRGERQRIIAAVMRLGYDMDTVREAMRRLARDSHT